MDKKKGAELLKNQLNQIDGLIKNADTDNHRQWREETLMILDHIVSEESKYYKNFEDIRYHSQVVSMGDAAGNKIRHEEAYKRGLEKAKSSLQAILFGIDKGLL